MTPPSPLQKTPAPETRPLSPVSPYRGLFESGVARAAGSPLVRGGLTIGAGIVIGNIFGFFRVAFTAYLLGTHSTADSLAVAISPIDTLNQALINTIIFAFVPLLTGHTSEERIALIAGINRLFTRFFLGLTVAISSACAATDPRCLLPGLPPSSRPRRSRFCVLGRSLFWR